MNSLPTSGLKDVSSLSLLHLWHRDECIQCMSIAVVFKCTELIAVIILGKQVCSLIT